MGEHWAGYIGSLHVHWDTLITMWFAMLVVILLSFFITRNLQIKPGKAQTIAESILKFFIGNLQEVKNGEKHIPIVASLFLFILVPVLIALKLTRQKD